jgi:type IV pilus assembly protein PilW
MRPFLTARIRQRGVTLLELMIGMTIGLIASVVIVQVFSQSEAHRRATAGGADAQQAGMIASWRMMRDIRMAGSGLQHGVTLWGCQMLVWRGGAQLLPRAGAWPAPFAAFPSALRLTPIAVVDGGGAASDAILVSSARSGAGAAPLPASVVSSTQVSVPTSVAFRAQDLLLMTDMSAVGDCQLGQVDAAYVAPAGVPAPRAVPVGAPSTGYNGPNGFSGLPSTGDYSLFNLGSAPSVAMYGVVNNSLVQYDVLDPAGIGASTVQAENVENLQVLLGVDDGVGGTANDNVVDRWVAPGTAPFTAAAMIAGGNAALQVKAIRIAMVVRSSEPTQRVGPAETVLFQDMPAALQVRVPIPAADRVYGRQVHDLVIPLRNQWIALCTEARRANGVPAVGTCS